MPLEDGDLFKVIVLGEECLECLKMIGQGGTFCVHTKCRFNHEGRHNATLHGNLCVMKGHG